MDRILSAIFDYFRNRKTHSLLPLLLFLVTVVVGLLTQAWIGAICFVLAIYFTLVIFVPWNRIVIVKKRPTLSGFAVPAILCALIFTLTWNNVVAIFPNSSEQQPSQPVIQLIPNPNPPQHAGTTQNITISAKPAPGYVSYINPEITTNNTSDSPPYCHITLEIHLTGGFKFGQLTEIPVNFQVKDGYLDNDNMTVDINHFPSNWTYSGFKIPVYNMDRNTVPDSENQHCSYNTTVRFEH